MIDSYPTVDFSLKLIQILNQKPALPKMPTEPVKPSEPIYNSEGIGCGSSLFTGIAVFSTIICIIALITAQIPVALTFGLVGGGAFLMTFMIGNAGNDKQQNNIEKAKHYKENCKKYEEDLLIYNDKRKDYESQITTLTSIEYIDKFRKELLGKQISEDKQLISELSSTKTTVSNVAISFFEPFLAKTFKDDNILQKVVLDNSFLHFIIYDESGININIEIDEPYSDKTGITKNTIDDSKDSKFSITYLLKEKNITCIRFAEEQIFKYPIECIEYISKVKKALLENTFYIDDDEFPYMLSMWTKEQAHSMAFKRYRNSYIPEKYHTLL